MEINKRLRIAKYGYTLLSFLICIFGLVIIFYSSISFKALRISISIFLIGSAFFRIFGYLAKDRYRLAFQYDLAFGFISLILGCVMISKKSLSNSTIYFSLGLYVLADSLFKIQIAIDAKEFGLRRWWLILIAAFLASASGLILIIMAHKTYTDFVIQIGISLLADGILSLITVLTAVNILQKKLPANIKLDNE